MAGKAYTEPISIMQAIIAIDGQGGHHAIGESVYIEVLATIKETVSRLSTEDKVEFTNVIAIEFPNDPSKSVTESNWIVWRNKSLSISGLQYTDNQKKVQIKAVAR